MRIHHLCWLGGVLLLAGCLQRGAPKKEAPPCPELLPADPYAALTADGGVPRRGRKALGSDAGSAPPGALDKNVIREVILMNRGDVIACYEQVLQLEPDAPPHGEVAVSFVISETGDVCATKIARSGANHPGLERCILDAVGSWRFPPPKGGGVVKVTYPFFFRPGVRTDGGVQAPVDAGP